MSLTPDHRHAFRRWLIDHDLQPEVADAILETMPPFDWSKIARRDETATKTDVADRTTELGTRLDARIDTLYNAMLWGFASMMLGFVAVIISVFLAA